MTGRRAAWLGGSASWGAGVDDLAARPPRLVVWVLLAVVLAACGDPRRQAAGGSGSPDPDGASSDDRADPAELEDLEGITDPFGWSPDLVPEGFPHAAALLGAGEQTNHENWLVSPVNVRPGEEDLGVLRGDEYQEPQREYWFVDVMAHRIFYPSRGGGHNVPENMGEQRFGWEHAVGYITTQGERYRMTSCEVRPDDPWGVGFRVGQTGVVTLCFDIDFEDLRSGVLVVAHDDAPDDRSYWQLVTDSTPRPPDGIAPGMPVPDDWLVGEGMSLIAPPRALDGDDGTSEPGSVPDLEGRWTGTYSCRGEPFELILTFAASGGAVDTATFEFVAPDGTSGSLALEVAPDGAGIDLRATDWIEHPGGFVDDPGGGWVTVDLRVGEVSGDPPMQLTGNVLAAGCAGFEVTRSSP